MKKTKRIDTQLWLLHLTNHVCELEVRPGGAFCIDMRGPDGVVYPNKGVLHDIARQSVSSFFPAPLKTKKAILVSKCSTLSRSSGT